MTSSFVFGVVLLAMLASLAFMWVGQKALSGRGAGFMVFAFAALTIIFAPYIGTLIYALHLVTSLWR